MPQTIRGKLMGLAVVVMVAIAGIVAIWWLAFDTLKVNGPVYSQVVQVKDLVADILPPPEYILESYLEVAKAQTADPSELPTVRAKLAQLRKDFDDRHQFWAGNHLPATVADGLLVRSYGPALEFYKLVDERFLPALANGDKEAAAAAFKEMTAAYERHRAAIDDLVTASDQLSKETESSADASERTYKLLVMALSLGLTAMVVVAVVLIIRAITVPVARTVGVMERLARGDLDVEVAGAERRDEIGEMIRAVEIFKRNAIERLRLEEAEKASLARREARQRKLDNLTGDFDRAVMAVLTGVSAAAAKMTEMASGMTEIAEETARQGTVVSAATEEASTNVSTIAAASNEMSASIQEIANQVNRSATIAANAVSEMDTTNAKMESLASGANRIGEVVNLINDIASQTNLLALNATIEAARAGEAGKGFAVVANEVKVLASQTAKATGEIASQIQGIQEETRGAVEAIQRITAVIGEINEMSAAIAGAIEEQGAAMQEVVRNVDQAAQGTREVAANICQVVDAAGHTGAMAAQVEQAAGLLTGESGKLRDSVETFLTGVKAA